MRVLLVFGNCTVGGVQLLHLDLYREYTRLGLHVEFFWFQPGNLADQLPPGSRSHFGGLTDLLSLLSEVRFDIVHCSVWDLDLGVDAIKRLDDPPRLFATAHAKPCPEWWSGNCDALTGVSKSQARMQQRLTDLCVATVLNGVDTDVFSPGISRDDPGPPIVAWVGRATDLRQKRIDRLAGISDRLVAEGYRIRVVTADPVEAVRPAALREQLKRNCERWGRADKAGMAEFYRTVSASGGLLLMTSDFEGFGLNLLEAQACACPVIAPNIDGVNECVSPSHGGILYEHASLRELEDLVLSCLGNQEDLRDRANRVAAHARGSLTLKRMAAEYVSIYRSGSTGRTLPLPPLRMLVANLRYRHGLSGKVTRFLQRRSAANDLAKKHSASAKRLVRSTWRCLF